MKKNLQAQKIDVDEEFVKNSIILISIELKQKIFFRLMKLGLMSTSRILCLKNCQYAPIVEIFFSTIKKDSPNKGYLNLNCIKFNI